MRYQKTLLRKLFGPAGLADYIFPLLASYWTKEVAKKSKEDTPVSHYEKAPSVPLHKRLKEIPWGELTKKTRSQMGSLFKKSIYVLLAFWAWIWQRVFPLCREGLSRLKSDMGHFFRNLPNGAVHLFEQLQTWWYRLRVRLKGAWPELVVMVREKGLRIASVLTLSVISLVATVVFTLGYAVRVNGETIGIIHSPEEFKTMEEAVRRDFESLEIDQKIEFSPTVAQQKHLLDQKDLRKAFLETYDRTVEGAVIQVNGEPRAVLFSEEEAFVALKALQEKYGEEGAKVTFDQPVEVLKKAVPLSMAVGVETAVEQLEGKQSKDGLYTVREGDTFWSIAMDYGMDAETLMAINQSKNERIVIGDTLTVRIPEPYLSIRATRTVTYTEKIPYTTRQIEDSSMYRGKTAVVASGVAGEKEIEATIVKVNGLEVSRTVLSETVLAQPTERIVKVGTKTPPRTMATGSFARPASGSLTSRFGYRWGRSHQGIDVGAGTGTPIYAADGGVVTLSGWNGAYGKMITINHENGYVTNYAHCSRLAVSAGRRVAKGDVIAYVGNTGRSTGPHLHFEVRKNGTPQNPLNYVSY